MYENFVIRVCWKQMIQASSRKRKQKIVRPFIEYISSPGLILSKFYWVSCIVNNAVLPSFEFLTLHLVLRLFTGVFKVPARYICGYDPCSGAICKSDPTARCLVDHSCNSIFVNSFNQRMGSCKGEPIPPKDILREVPCEKIFIEQKLPQFVVFNSFILFSSQPHCQRGR